MRLLNTTTLRLESFFDSTVPEYAILSHTWDTEEVLFEDICDPRGPFPEKKGFAKVQKSCDLAQHDGYGYMWIDTCCIDKSSSAELSEAINSMFRWYQGAARCYAYLADVVAPEEGVVPFEESRWFTRGWTLQELIAPKTVRFYDCHWELIGERRDLADRINARTGIPTLVLRWYNERKSKPFHSSRLSHASVSWQFTMALSPFGIAQKLSWASDRATTRVEDEAYCLLGLFEVNMPLLYGEGRRAFFRLQQEILRISNDQSILAFEHQYAAPRRLRGGALLADSPRCFAGSLVEPPRLNAPLWPGARWGRAVPELSPSSKALEMSLCLCPLTSEFPESNDGTTYLGILDCVYHDDITSHPAIFLEALDTEKRAFKRMNGRHLARITPMDLAKGTGALGLRFDLSQAFFSTVRLYFHPPEQDNRGVMLFPAPGPTTSAPGVRFKLHDAKTHALASYGSYPQNARADDDNSMVYIPSMNIGAWHRKQPQSRGRGIQVFSGLLPFGVVILRNADVGDLVFTWGERESDYSAPMWFAVFGWHQVASACGISQDFDSCSASAKSVFENRERLMALINPSLPRIVTVDFPSYKVRCKGETVSFFGRNVLDIDVTVVKTEKEGE